MTPLSSATGYPQRLLEHWAGLLDRLGDDPSKALDLSRDIATALLARCAVVQGALVGRLLAGRGDEDHIARGDHAEDRLLSVAEAAEKLGTSRDWVYRHADQLPFTVRVGRHLRFSAQGIDRYIRVRTGR